MVLMFTATITVDTRYDRATAGAWVGDLCQGLVTDFVNDGITYATLRTPVRTGRLRAANTAEVDTPSPFRCEGRMVNPTAYALDVHQGTPPHRIEPRTATVLRFEVGGETVFTPYVNHPGTRPRPFLAEGAAESAAQHNFIYTPTI
jgi:hypothetical protein